MAEDTQEVQERTGKQLDGQQSIFDLITPGNEPYSLQETKADDGSDTIEAATRKENILQENNTGTPGPSKPGRIRIEYNLNVDPKLDPNSPEFDFVAWKAAMNASKDILAQKTREALARIEALLSKYTESINPPEEMHAVVEAMQGLRSDLTDWMETGNYTAIMDSVEAAVKPADKPITASAKRAESIEYPLDKVNSIIWNLLEEDTEGQISLAVEKHGSGKDINILYSIDFDDLGNGLKISKRLLPFDKRVYMAISALFNAGNTVISLTQIHYAMGNTTRPKKDQLQRINDAVKKMRGATITIDNEQEAKAYKYAKFIYEGSLLPLERLEASINGQVTEAAIHIFREPPVISFAKQRNQVTTIPVKLLQTPMNKTDANLLLEDYLLERISKAKGGKAPKKRERILFKTIFEKTNTSEKMQKTRQREKVKKYLAFYEQNKFIKRYTEEPDGVTVYF